jgi:hypothetical protein
MDQLTGAGIEEFLRRLGTDARRLGEDAERLLERLTGGDTAAAAIAPWASFQRPGDIVLTRGRRPISHLNAAVQSILEGGIARATHAMMVASPGYYVDSSVRFGVSVVPARLFCMDGAAEARRDTGPTVVAADPARPMWRRRLVGAYRHPALAAAPDRQQALLRAIAEQLGQPYNLRFIFKRVREEAEDKTAFCSELVARTFARLGLPIVPERRYARVLPHTLMRHLSRQGWVDVSDDYRQGLPRAFAA